MIFDIPTFVKQYIPVDKRLPKFLASLQSFLYGLNWRMGVFTDYINGATKAPYNSATTYGIGSQVRLNFSAYESLIDGNTGNQPDLNIDNGKWILRNKYMVGAIERTSFNGRYLNLTWALNRHFRTTFRQPPYPAPYDFGLGSGTFSDIYITNNDPVSVSFGFSNASQDLGGFSTVSRYNGFATVTIIAGVTNFQANIYFPVAVYNALGANDAIRESVVRDFVDKYMVIGGEYFIITY